MRDIFKKLAVAGLTYGGLEYAKYRMEGGKPLLEKAQQAMLFVKEILDTEKEGPVMLGESEYKIE